MSEWLKETVCKIVGNAYRGSNPLLPTSLAKDAVRTASFRSFFRPRSSVVEHFFGKEEVKGPIPFVGFQHPPRTPKTGTFEREIGEIDTKSGGKTAFPEDNWEAQIGQNTTSF